MAASNRDRTARSRIREYLATTGPVTEADGRATATLKQAVHYAGSDVAFIQLVTAMAKDGEIEREIRGKRTYGISLPRSTTAITAATSSVIDTPTQPDSFSFDYDALARALIREAVRVFGPQPSTAATDSLRAERDEYARRLRVAREQLDSAFADSTDDRSRAERSERAG